jgi:hypothetical protein
MKIISVMGMEVDIRLCVCVNKSSHPTYKYVDIDFFVKQTLQ